MAPRPFYPPGLYDPAPIPSWWEASAGPRVEAPPLAGDATVEVAIVGGGFAGLSTAYHLAREQGIEATLLEAGHIGWGSSARNAGFVCMPAAKLGLEELIRRAGLAEARRYLRTQREAIDLVAALIGEEAIEVQRQGAGMWIAAHSPRAFQALRDYAAILTGQLDTPTRLVDAAGFAAETAAGTENCGALLVVPGFALHPLRYQQGLARAAQARGARLHGHSKVLAWQKRDGWHHLSTAGGTLRARRLVVAANAWLEEGLLPPLDGRILPVVSNILVTRPLSEAERRATNLADGTPVNSTRNLLHYYRLLPDGRLLFGARGDTGGSAAGAARMRAWVERRLGQVFPGLAGVETTHFWRGLVCLSRRLLPSLGRLPDDPSLLFAYACHGNGIHHMTWSGRQLARMIKGEEADEALLPALIRGRSDRFPLPRLRPWYLRGAYALMALKDAR